MQNIIEIHAWADLELPFISILWKEIHSYCVFQKVFIQIFNP